VSAIVFTPGTPEAEAAGRQFGFKGHAVTLADGTVACSWSPEWRAECARRVEHVHSMLNVFRGVEVRRAHLERVERQEGALFRRRLEEAVRAEWDARRAARVAELAAQEAAAYEGYAE
jgi:hypothetical protein